jgi:hypothetical protein
VEEEVILILQILQLEILISTTTPGLLLIQEVQIILQQEQIQGTIQIRIHNLTEVTIINRLLYVPILQVQAIHVPLLHSGVEATVEEATVEAEDHLAEAEEDKS